MCVRRVDGLLQYGLAIVAFPVRYRLLTLANLSKDDYSGE